MATRWAAWLPSPSRTILAAIDPDLSDFKGISGKLIMAHGWSDPALPALYTVEYYEAAEGIDPALRQYARLFMMPGGLHCTGGPGPDQVDWLGALQAWVEDGTAPDRLIAEKIDDAGDVVLSRPLCPHPEVAVYDGTGDPNSADSFACAAP